MTLGNYQLVEFAVVNVSHFSHCNVILIDE